MKGSIELISVHRIIEYKQLVHFFTKAQDIIIRLCNCLSNNTIFE